MYYNPDTKTVLKDHSAIRAALPPTVFLPSVLTDADIAALGCYALHVDEKPVDCTRVFSAGMPIVRDGIWCLPWESRAATSDEIVLAQNAGIAELIQGAVDRLNVFAATRMYGNGTMSPIDAACSWAVSEHERYRREGRYCILVRDQTWSALTQMQEDVFAGGRPLPVSFPEFEPELPELKWPDDPET